MKKRFCDACEAEVNLDNGIPGRRSMAIDVGISRISIQFEVEISAGSQTKEGDLCLKCLTGALLRMLKEKEKDGR